MLRRKGLLDGDFLSCLDLSYVSPSNMNIVDCKIIPAHVYSWEKHTTLTLSIQGLPESGFK